MSQPDPRKAVEQLQNLPTLPAVLGKVVSMTADPDTSALNLGQVVASDQSLSAAILRLVNSPYYGFYRQIDSVTQAIVMLGFLETRNVALAATAFRALQGGSGSYDRTQLWRHTLATAMAAEQCAKLTGEAVPGCFESGLLHDIGKVAFDKLFPDEFLKAADLAHGHGIHVDEAEREVLGIDHAEAGAILAEHWNLPTSVVEAIRNHHAPSEAGGDARLTALVAVANHITYLIGLGESSNGCPREFPEKAAAVLGITTEQCAQLGEDLEKNHERIDEFVGSLSA